MTISCNRMKIHTKKQMRERKGKKRIIFLGDEPQSAWECRRERMLGGGGGEGGMMKVRRVESTLASYPVFSVSDDKKPDYKRIGL